MTDKINEDETISISALYSMKKFFKIYLPILVICFSIFTGLFVYLATNHLPILLYMFGKARLHSNQIKSKVIIDGIEQSSAKVFLLNDGENNGKLIVFNQDIPVIVNKKENDIGTTNSSDCYELVFDKYLFQSDLAYAVIYAKSEKWGYNAKLAVTDSKITYFIESRDENENMIDHKTEIFLDN